MDSVTLAAERSLSDAKVSPVLVPRSKKVRSKLSNGKKLLPLSDGRSATARRFRDLYEDIVNDLGGPDLVSQGQKQLARRAAMLSAECERLEALAVRDERPRTDIKWRDEAQNVFDLDAYGVLSDRLCRIFQRLGLARRAREVTSPLIDHFSKGARRGG